MSERRSMWSEVMMARGLAEAVCPDCGETNTKGRKHLIELNEQGSAYCNACGFSFQAIRPTVRAVNE